jgi:hypothetical protein
MEEVPMGDTVNLPIALDSETGRALITDLARFSEGVCSEQEVRKRHRFDESTWNALGDNEKLLEEVEAEKLRRIRSGAAKREKSQHLVVKAPEVVSGIMLDSTQNARHRLDAAKVLDQFAANGPGDARASETVFLIKFDLTAGGGEVETIEKTLSPMKSSSEPWPDIDTTPKELLPAIAANKHKDGGSGEPI